jgi:DNA polymerase-3 subunit epsilon
MKRSRTSSPSSGAAPRLEQERGPPPGPPWDLPIADTPFAFVDLEMTGLDVKADRVIEICVVRRRGTELESSLETLVNPGSDLDWQEGVHGITRADLAAAPRFGALASRVAAILDGAVLVAHAAWWDVTFLEKEFTRIEKPVIFPFYLDSLILARRALRADGYSLKALVETLGIPQRVTHRAGDDVRALCAVFDRVCAELAPRSARDLWHVRVAERHARPEILAACAALAGTGEPAWVTYRPSHKQPRSFQAIIAEMRTDLDPPRVLGYSLPGRGRFDLRTDRILSIDRNPRTS